MSFDIMLTQVLENGLIAACFVFVLYWILNKFSADLRLVAIQMQVVSLILIGFQKQFLLHDAQVRGINPSTGDTEDERHNMALAEYKTLQKGLDSLIDQITAIIEPQVKK